MTRPAWVDDELFPFESRFVDVDGARLHYIDEGSGPVLLCLHGNPTWSFLYRHIVTALRDQFRCIAVDFPGFGLSTAPPGYRWTSEEHARVLAGFVTQLQLDDITLLVQDWGGPIGFRVATQQPDLFSGFVIGNTWAWPVHDDPMMAWFSRILGSRIVGGFLLKRLDIFSTVMLRAGIRRRKLTSAEHAMYRRPHPDPESRIPIHVMPREILAARPMLAEIEAAMGGLADKPALLVWPDQDKAFRSRYRERWERTFPRRRTVILRGASHYIPEDAPDEIVAAIREWWPTR